MQTATTTLRELAAQVAMALNEIDTGIAEAWTVAPARDDIDRDKRAGFSFEGCVYLNSDHHPERRISLTYNAGYGQHSKKLRVHPHYPKHGNEWYPTRSAERTESINMSPTKNPQQIAKEIARRIFATYNPSFAAGLKQRDDWRDHDERSHALTAELTRQVSNEVPLPGTREFHEQLPNGRLTVEVNGPDSVTLKISSIKPELARQIIAILTGK